MIASSIKKYGAGRPILIDKDGIVIAGNHTLTAALDAGLTTQTVQTDGHTLIVVQRTDLSLDTPKARELAIADNRTAQVNLNWDSEALSQLQADGVPLNRFFDDDELADILEIVPDFKPIPVDEVGRLDQKVAVLCPQCGEHFIPA